MLIRQEGKERAEEIFMIGRQSSTHAAVAVRKSTACVRAHMSLREFGTEQSVVKVRRRTEAPWRQ
jgi:hypothetical protein